MLHLPSRMGTIMMVSLILTSYIIYSRSISVLAVGGLSSGWYRIQLARNLLCDLYIIEYLFVYAMTPFLLTRHATNYLLIGSQYFNQM